MVLKKLVELKGLSHIISLHFAPTMREESGLAMSSRNLRLTLEQKEKAKLIYERMSTIKQQYLTKPLIEIEKETTDYLNSNGFIVDYVAICNVNTLKPPLAKTDKLIVLIAASIGSIRLIDNMLLN
jgi:pantoate--beta-alanine ligase